MRKNFKKSLIYTGLVIYLTLASCSNNSKNLEKDPQFVPPKPITKSTELRYDTIMEEKFGIPGISSFPFGCPAVVEIPFPQNWKIIEKAGTEFMEYSYFNKVLLSINTCLTNINNAGTHQEKPKITSLKHLYLGNGTLFCDEHLDTDSMIYLLDDMGPYKVYYAFGSFYNLHGHDKEHGSENCVEYGNLVLVHKKTGAANVLNLYMAKGRDNDINMRVFYIDSDKLIHIKEFECNASTCSYNKYFVGEVKDDGKITFQKVSTQ